MRLSVQKGDPGYSPFAVGAEVFCNGEKLQLCITADEERGYALVYSPDEEGKAHIVDGPRGPDVAIHSVRGDIKIVLGRAQRLAMGI